jgi:hypothetical protein
MKFQNYYYIALFITIFSQEYCFSKTIARFLQYSALRYMQAKDFMRLFPTTQQIHCFDKFYFQYPQLSLEETFGHSDFDFKDYLDDIFVLRIPQAKAVYDNINFLWINDVFITEIAPKIGLFDFNFYNPRMNIPLHRINGRVVALYHPSKSMYGHYVLDILGMLAVLEMNNIEYDYVCLPYDKKFMKELINLWGIPEHKIIQQEKGWGFIADEILVPSNVSRDSKSVKYVNFYHPIILDYIRTKILNKISSLNIDVSHFSKKIFLSRKDAQYRNIPNEDEIFELFAQKGFVRYEASKLSVAEQIALFHNATHIAGATGSNMTNLIFSKPETYFLLFIQNFADRTFYILSLIFDLKYYAICDTTKEDLLFGKPDAIGRMLDIKKVESFLYEHKEF